MIREGVPKLRQRRGGRPLGEWNAMSRREKIDFRKSASACADAIVLIETVGGRAGMALLTRDDCRRHPLLATH